MSFLAYLVLSVFLDSGLTRITTYDSSYWKTPFTFDHGYVLVWDDPMDMMITREPALALFAPGGRKIYATSLKTPDGVSASALSGAIDADGTVAVVYRDWAKPRPRNGVAVLSKDGKTATFVATDPYVPGHICFDVDGTLWTAGTQGADTAEFMTVRKHSRSGGQTGAFLPLGDLIATYDPNHHFLFHQMIGGWRMRAAKDQLGMIAEFRPVGQWMELSREGKVLGRWDIAPHVSTPAITFSGVVYAQLLGDGGPPALMTLDKTTGKWSKTGTTLDGRFVGTDGDDVVFRMGTTGGNLFVWVRLRAQWGSTAR
jgi:hypothetical protein